ncbi:hypothetical protein Dda_4182 [Drechslerella dactyloides]|uniref:Uncharacterized protein n=1 Tax=Drechslerella dactyloides TaxID=74499 RepID=A0AAD6J055_DREDA|nr:hypothetical protein Dda_4182 [Drechslerella dactyloides]
MALPTSILARQFSHHAARQPGSRTSTLIMYGYLIGGFTTPFIAPAILGRNGASHSAADSQSTLGGFGGHCCSR